MPSRFSTAILDEAIKRKKREREELRLSLLAGILSALDELTNEIPFTEAYIFGSVVRPYGYSEESDVDIAFVGLKDKDFFRAMSIISRKIGREVDIVQMERHRLSQEIRRRGIKWTRKS